MTRYNRRSVLKASAAFAGASALGFPAIVRAQTDKIKIGHLTPLTGFLGALGAYAQLGIEWPRKRSTQPAASWAPARPMSENWSIRRPRRPRRSACSCRSAPRADGRDQFGLGGDHHAGSRAQQALFLQIGARSDALRGKNCNRYTFHVDIPITVMVNAVGKALVRDNMVKGKKFFTLTADYIFGHDLLAAAKHFFGANRAS